MILAGERTWKPLLKLFPGLKFSSLFFFDIKKNSIWNVYPWQRFSCQKKKIRCSGKLWEFWICFFALRGRISENSDWGYCPTVAHSGAQTKMFCFLRARTILPSGLSLLTWSQGKNKAGQILWMAGSGKPMLLTALRQGGRLHTWSSYFPAMRALAGPARPEPEGNVGSRWPPTADARWICPGGSPESHGLWSKRRPGGYCADSGFWLQTGTPKGVGGIMDEKGETRREISREGTIGNISLTFQNHL